MDDDPLAERQVATIGPCTACGSKRCPCRRCHGVGWCRVQQRYVRRIVPDPPMEELARRPAAEQAQVWAEVHRLRSMHGDSWYPCSDCNRPPFFRWAGGHWEPTHNASECDECRHNLGRRAARRQAVTAERERKDLD